MTHLLIQAHPRADSFSAALGAAWLEGAGTAGVETDRVDLMSLDFDPIYRGPDVEQPLEPDLIALRARIDASRTVAFSFPTWWAQMPALLKGMIDRTFLPGWAYRYHRGQALPEGLLAGRSARIITTMDSPWWWYRWMHGRSLHRSLHHATLNYCGIRDVRETTVYATRRLDAAGRADALKRARADGAADARRAR